MMNFFVPDTYEYSLYDYDNLPSTPIPEAIHLKSGGWFAMSTDIGNWRNFLFDQQPPMFYDTNVINVDLSSMSLYGDVSNLLADIYSIKSLLGINTGYCTNMSGMFKNISISSSWITNLNTENCRNMSGMFNGITFTNYPVSITFNYNTSRVTDMSEMFANITEHYEINISSFTAESLVNVDKMFDKSNNLIVIVNRNFYDAVDKNIFNNVYQVLIDTSL
jgi:hypothetical protein